MTDRELNDDDVLQAALGEAFDAAEPGSPAAEALARAAVELGSVDGELAELVSDSYADHGDALAVRAEPTEDRLLAYEHDDVAVELDLPAGDPRVIGQVELGGDLRGPIEVELVSAAGAQPFEVDDLGRFQGPLPAGSVRFVVRTGDEVLTTPWITR